MSVLHSNIPEKANRILNLVLFSLVLIGLRVWYLSVIQYDARLEESKRPQNRTVVEPASRATIRDRFNLPLAVNKMQYRVAIQYSQFKQIPSIAWRTSDEGKKIKYNKRREYISSLSRLLADELNLDSERLDDLIASKAALYFNLPFVIKEEIPEELYFRLKMLEKDWPGLLVQRLPRRTYPLGKVGADIVGYMGAINQSEYEAIITEIKVLEKFLKGYQAGEDSPFPPNVSDVLTAEQRLSEIKELAYTMNDYVGKAGIEGRFDRFLRGFRGKKQFYTDAKGNFLRELPGARDPIPGQRFVLTISAELQEFAEELLIKNERIREAQISNPDGPQEIAAKQPWIKGGAIVAIDPTNGEVLALASYPRYDPNDFIASANPELNAEKQAHILRWLESDSYLGQIWDQKRPLERERYADDEEALFEDEQWINWDRYIFSILAPDSFVKEALDRFGTIQNAYTIGKAAQFLLEASGQNNAYWLMEVLFGKAGQAKFADKLLPSVRQAIEENLELQADQVAINKALLGPFLNGLSSHYDKVLFIDLCRLIVSAGDFNDALLKVVENKTFADYRNAASAKAGVEPFVKGLSQTIFHEHEFKEWRQKNGKQFIQEKRKEEKKDNRYTKPYIDYLDEQENSFFAQFWSEHSGTLISAFLSGGDTSDELGPYMQEFNQWHREINGGAHAQANWRGAYQTLKKYMEEIPKELSADYLKSLRTFKELNRPLLGKYRSLRHNHGIQLEKHLAMAFYPQHGFGYGRSHAYRQSAIQGSVFKLVTGYAAMAQRCRQLGSKVTSENINPLTMVDYVRKSGKKTWIGTFEDGTPIPQLYKGGRLAKSIMRAIGKIDIIKAIEVSSNPYFSIIAGDILESPDALLDAARALSYGSRTGIDLPGEISGSLPTDLATNKTGVYSSAIGQHSLVVTPLQTSLMLCAIANGGNIVKPHVTQTMKGLNQVGQVILTPPKDGLQNSWNQEPNRAIYLPGILRDTLLGGMKKVVSRLCTMGIGNLSVMYRDYPEAISDFIDLEEELLGKTGTAESMERDDLDLVHGANKYTHIWFGGIAFDPNEETYVMRDKWGRPEIVVVVYLRYGKYGSYAAPLAAQVVKKWRQIKARRLVKAAN